MGQVSLPALQYGLNQVESERACFSNNRNYPAQRLRLRPPSRHGTIGKRQLEVCEAMTENPRFEEALQSTAHRPWPLMESPWVLAQSWHNLLFAHWPIDAATLRGLIPPQLQLDTFDGHAWLSVVPFEMQNIHPRGLPATPWLSRFLELNVRTYVIAPDGAKPGVWFFSLDAANPVAVLLAQSLFRLPYFNAQMGLIEHDGAVHYQSRRTHRNAAPALFVARYQPTGRSFTAIPGSLDHWLAERYCLYATDERGAAYRAEIHHRPWPLQPAEAEFAVNDVVESSGFRVPDCEPLLHFARHLDVLTWPLHRIS